VTGVGFFDFNHGQTGRAPNVIELDTYSASRERAPDYSSEAHARVAHPRGCPAGDPNDAVTATAVVQLAAELQRLVAPPHPRPAVVEVNEVTQLSIQPVLHRVLLPAKSNGRRERAYRGTGGDVMWEHHSLRSAQFKRILGCVATPRLVFLYGPPAVGKLTVAKAIAERLPFKILHNHVTIDAVTEVLPFGSDTFWRVVGRFRRDLVAAAAEENIDLIYTFVFAPGDEQHVADIVSSYENAEGAVSFVQLLAPREVLRQRVLADSRRQYGKPTDAETLDRMLDEYDCFAAIPERDSLTIDLATTSANDAADQIIEHVTTDKRPSRSPGTAED